MRILMYAPIFPPQIGGPSTQSHNLSRALVARGETPIVVAPSPNGFKKEILDGFVVYRYRWHYTRTRFDTILRWIIFPPYFLGILFRERPDILHCHSVSVSSFIAGFFAKLFGTPSIIKFAGDWVWETLSTNKLHAKDFGDIYTKTLAGRLLKRIERVGLSLFDVIWCPSQFRRENVRAVLGDDSNVRIIPNALLLSRGGYRDEKGSDPFIVISANRFIPHKRVSLIVRAFHKMNVPDSKLVLIGTGSTKEVDAVRQVIAELGIEKHVTLTGRLSSEDVYTHLARASLYVSASLEEGFPNVFIEAMHYGLPIISTDVGGCREMVVDGGNGFLVDPHNEDTLADRMRRLATNRALRNTMAKNAYERSKQYDLSAVVERFIALYRELARDESR